MRIEVFTGMTSNRFLARLGKPTAMESRIGNIYQTKGLESAFAYIEESLLAVLEKQRRYQINKHGSW